MAWIATAVVATAVVGGLVSKRQGDVAASRAKRDAKKSRRNAREAEAFANTEGKALGDLGVVDLSVDDELDADQKLRKKGRISSTLSI